MMPQEQTAQEIFDQAYNGILAQGKPAKTKNNNCFYRLELKDGTILKCGAGQLLSDEEYDPIMDAKGENGLTSNNNGWMNLWKKGLTPSRLEGHRELICDIQNAHDKASIHTDKDNDFIKEFKEIMEDVASFHLLKVPA